MIAIDIVIIKTLRYAIKKNVPYAEKDLAKAKGAFWDNEIKSWYIPDHKDINLFKEWIDTK